ncbi:MAG: VanW family protein, partial [Clostridia bacterium]|nr:VanW family protein [Clostridia bacterium]
MKKIISLLLALTLALGLCPAGLTEWGWGDSWSDGWGNDYSSGSSYSVTGTTNLFYASSAQLTNINIALSRLASFDIAYGEHFSFNDKVGPRTAQYGYKNAVNARGVVTRGGGVG